MSIDVPYKSMADIARERLWQFMKKNDANADDVARVMGLANKKPIQEILQSSGDHYLSDNVIAEFGSQGLDNAVAKLNKIRAPKASGLDEVRPQVAGDEPDEKQGEPKAARVVDVFQKPKAPEATGLADAELVKLKDMRPVVKGKVKTPVHDYRKPNDDDIRLIAAMDAFVKTHNMPDTKAAEMLGYTKSYFGQVRNRIKNKLKVPHLKILKAIADYDADDGVRKGAHGLDIAPLWFTCDRCGSRVDDGESCSNIVCETIDKVTCPLAVSAKGPSGTSEARLREQGKIFVTELFGLSEHELRAIAPEVDIILAAKRHGTPFKIVVGR